MHVSKINYIDFFESAFDSRSEAQQFIEAVEKIPTDKCKAGIVLHQTARMVWLGDRINEVAMKRPALQVLFHLIAAEAVAKIVKGFKGEGQSRQYVRLFFEDICSDEHRDIFGKTFSRLHAGYLSVRDTVDILYDIRCDVVHEGMYFGFSLPEKGESYPELTMSRNEPLTAYITIEKLRQIVIEGAVLGAKKLASGYI